jgi:hypothetical protein
VYTVQDGGLPRFDFPPFGILLRRGPNSRPDKWMRSKKALREDFTTPTNTLVIFGAFDDFPRVLIARADIFDDFSKKIVDVPPNPRAKPFLPLS